MSTVRVVGGASAGNFPTVDRWTKTGFIVDYRTSAGYSKRVFLSCGTHTGREFTLTPAWGCAKVPHEKIFVGRRNAYEFDLRRYAPADWDGTCWFSLYMQNAGRNRNLKATIVWK